MVRPQGDRITLLDLYENKKNTNILSAFISKLPTYNPCKKLLIYFYFSLEELCFEL
ncbi:MAG: hypothetical protein MJ252_21185 [archaeon]|nr:hypothetical protein [archaeon]